ncbi:MAG: hypothetical protein H0X37_03450 [Herpetosiphonaceae bacterium]|nr:hypothetical protein [Herpetosiphonaceae bacterium]
MRRLLRLLIAVVALLAWLPTLASAQTPQVHWTNYDYQINVAKNGDLEFTESQRLVVDSGSVHKGSLHFDTGNYGRVRQIQVAEDGQPYQRDTTGATGTFSGDDNGTRLQVDYYFRDPLATQHTMTISYIVGQAIRLDQGQPLLQLKLFCQGSSCPATNAASAQINFVAPIQPSELQTQTSGFNVEQTSSGQGIKLVPTSSLSGQSLAVSMRFPSSAIPDANLTNQPASSQSNPNIQPAALPNSPNVLPSSRVTNLAFSPVLCVLVIFFLFVVISIMRSSARTRRSMPYNGPMMEGPMMGGYPRRRRRWGGGFFPWGGYGGWGGGWGGGYGTPPPFGNPPNDSTQPVQPDLSGGGQSWSDSGGGGQSWSDSSSGGGSSWSDSGGGGSFNVGDSGGGGNSGGDSGGGSFGGDNGSSFS